MGLLLDINRYPSQARNHSWIAIDKNGNLITTTPGEIK